MAQNHSKVFKLKVVQEFIGGASASSLARKYQVHQNTIYKWRELFRNDPSGAFRAEDERSDRSDKERITALEQENAQLAQLLGKTMLEQDFLKRALRDAEQYLTRSRRENGTE